MKQSTTALFALTTIIVALSACGSKDTSKREDRGAGPLAEKAGPQALDVLGTWKSPVAEPTEDGVTREQTMIIEANKLTISVKCSKGDLSTVATVSAEAVVTQDMIMAATAAKKEEAAQNEAGEKLNCSASIAVEPVKYSIVEEQLFFEVNGSLQLAGEVKVKDAEPVAAPNVEEQEEVPAGQTQPAPAGRVIPEPRPEKV